MWCKLLARLRRHHHLAGAGQGEGPDGLRQRSTSDEEFPPSLAAADAGGRHGAHAHARPHLQAHPIRSTRAKGVLRFECACCGVTYRGHHTPIVGEPHRQRRIARKLEDLSSVTVHGLDEAAEEQVQEILEVFGAARAAPGECLGHRSEAG